MATASEPAVLPSINLASMASFLSCYESRTAHPHKVGTKAPVAGPDGRLLLDLADERVNADQERGQGFARASGCGQQHVLA